MRRPAIFNRHGSRTDDHDEITTSPLSSDPAINPTTDPEKDDPDVEKQDLPSPDLFPAFTPAGDTANPEHKIQADKLNRKLSARQVQMIAIGGTIGTGLFLGTGKSLATGGPAAMLICYLIVGFIIILTMLALGEMAAFIPVAGSFCTFAGRFVDDSFGFALTWNYWFNDAVSTAADLVAVQLVVSYWEHIVVPDWSISLIFWGVLVAANIITVRAYGEVCEVSHLADDHVC